MAKIIDTSTLLETTSLSYNEKEWVYNGLDCCVTLEVFHELERQIDPIATRTYEFSKALQAPILEMTMRGVLVDIGRRDEVLRLYTEQVERLQVQLNAIVSEGVGWSEPTVNTTWWRSPAKLKTLFYDIMGMPQVRKRNAKGAFVPTLNREALEKLSDYLLAEPIARHILTLRDLDKKRGFLRTSIDADSRIRTNFNIAGTNTGRLASSMSDFGTGGNLQNVDRELRSVFVADPGYKFANLDLEQGDARNVGAICWDLFVEKYGEDFAGSYLSACESGDLHTTVCRMSRPDLPWTGDAKKDREIAEQIAYRQDSYRQLAKKLGHGTNYYGTPRTMAKHTKVETAIIEDFQHRYFDAFPVIGSADRDDRTSDNWHNHVRSALQSTHTLITPFGRRRMFFGRSFEDSTIREAIAYAPQSMTADEIDTGLLNVWRQFPAVQLLIQVHDSILLQYPEELEDEILPKLIQAMRVPLQLAKGREFVVPVDAKIGWNWGEVIYWSAADAAKGKCKADEVGKPKDNPDGLIKWKGHDTRRRVNYPAGTRSFDELFR